MLVLEKSRIYQGTLILVNQEFPVRFQQPERELRAIFPKQPEILMQRDSAEMLKQILLELKHCESVRNTSVRQFCGASGESISPRGNIQEEPIVGVSGYRTKAEQTEIYEDSLRENGRDFTEKYVALPDHSEHQTGLAIDLAENRKEIDFICPEFPYEGICQKFRERMASYGFVERYPEEKQKITGIGAEPWHFRYVGTPHAELMQEQNMVLEEYISWLKQFDLKKNPWIVRRSHAEIRIGYVKAQGDFTRIEGLETMMELTRLGYMKTQESNREFIRHTYRGIKSGKTASRYLGLKNQGQTSIQISGNNQDGFILTCITGDYQPSYGEGNGRR